MAAPLVRRKKKKKNRSLAGKYWWLVPRPRNIVLLRETPPIRAPTVREGLSKRTRPPGQRPSAGVGVRGNDWVDRHRAALVAPANRHANGQADYGLRCEHSGDDRGVRALLWQAAEQSRD